MSRLALTEKNPNRVAVQGLDINASIAPVEVLKALYTLKRAGWVRTPHGWCEGTDNEKFEFWKTESLGETDEATPTILEDHIMKRKDINKIDSLIAEAQVQLTGRWERTAMGGWRRILVEDTPSNKAKEDTKDNASSENEDTLVDSSAEGSELIYKGTKRAYEAYEHQGGHPNSRMDSAQPPQKRKRAHEPKRIRPQPNVNMDDYDVSKIHLEDEEEENITVFDTCDDIREKIKAHLLSSEMTRAAFMRLMCSAAFPTSNKTVQDRQLANFQGQDGPKRGCESNVYYAACIYFEKLRIKRKEPKSQKREEMEEIWGEEGMPRKIDRNSYIHGRGNTLYVDEYGVMSSTGARLTLAESIAEKASRNRVALGTYF